MSDIVEKTFDTGEKYLGQVNSNQQPHGQGKYTFKNGDVYEGEFVDNVIKGKGKFIFANGDTYEGEFDKDQFHGRGKLVDSANLETYEGEFVGGEKNGKGIYYYANGDVYEGDFKDGMKEGKGKWRKYIYLAHLHLTSVVALMAACHMKATILTATDMAKESLFTRYEGQFREGKKHGLGAIYYDNGDIYDGEFKNGAIEGKGTYKYVNGDNYTGVFTKEENFQNGGKFQFHNGDVYEGDFNGRSITGFGTMKYANGDFYEGEFLDGLRHGPGAFTDKEGKFTEGTFKHGSLVTE